MNSGQLVCTPYCDLENDTAPNACAVLCPNNEVEIWDDETMAPIGAFCIPGTGGTCDPLAQDCGPNQGCFGFEMPVCEGIGDVPSGGECAAIFGNTCQKGSTCMSVITKIDGQIIKINEGRNFAG